MGGGAAKLKLSSKLEKLAKFLLKFEKKRAHFRGFEDKGWGEGGNLKIVARRQKMSIIF